MFFLMFLILNCYEVLIMKNVVFDVGSNQHITKNIVFYTMNFTTCEADFSHHEKRIKSSNCNSAIENYLPGQE